MASIGRVGSALKFASGKFVYQVSTSLAVVGALLLTAASCTSGAVERPAGYFRLGSVVELAAQSESYFPEFKILIRKDEGGFAAMSTACTYDGSPLTRVSSAGAESWQSGYTESSYNSDGSVRHGPARVSLPYFDLSIESAFYGGPRDTLYVQVGKKRPSDWRLQVSSQRR